MSFITDAQKDCYERILPWVRGLFTTPPVRYQEQPPLIIVPMGSAIAMVEVVPWSSNDAMIRTWSYVVTGAELNIDLLHFLLRQNTVMNFGAFGVDDEGNIRFEHTIVGSTCDMKELQTSVRAVLETADQYDDSIAVRWGGKRALDRPLIPKTA